MMDHLFHVRVGRIRSRVPTAHTLLGCRRRRTLQEKIDGPGSIPSTDAAFVEQRE